MRHRATPRFWSCDDQLPKEVQEVADRAHRLLCDNSRHPPLHLKKVDKVWSVRVGMHYRALAVEIDDDLVWFWIGSQADYDRLLKQ